jgi:hypothetical protein
LTQVKTVGAQDVEDSREYQEVGSEAHEDGPLKCMDGQPIPDHEDGGCGHEPNGPGQDPWVPFPKHDRRKGAYGHPNDCGAGDEEDAEEDEAGRGPGPGEGPEGAVGKIERNRQLGDVVDRLLEHPERIVIEPVRPERDQTVPDEDGHQIAEERPAQPVPALDQDPDDGQHDQHSDQVSAEELERDHAIVSRTRRSLVTRFRGIPYR